MSRNSLLNTYVGSEVLPTGVNPFVPQPPSPDEKGVSAAWIVVLILLSCFMLAFLGFALWKWKVAQAQLNAGATAGADTVPLVNHVNPSG